MAYEKIKSEFHGKTYSMHEVNPPIEFHMYGDELLLIGYDQKIIYTEKKGVLYPIAMRHILPHDCKTLKEKMNANNNHHFFWNSLECDSGE